MFLFVILSLDTVCYPAALAQACSQSVRVYWSLGHALVIHYSLKPAITTRTYNQ